MKSDLDEVSQTFEEKLFGKSGLSKSKSTL